MTTVDDARLILWQHLLDVARWSRYYSKLHKSILFKNSLVRSLLACSGAGVTAGLFELFPSEWRQQAVSIFGTAIPVLIIVDLVSGWARKAAALEVICSDMSAIEHAYRTLWENYHLGRVDEALALSKSAKLIKRAHAISNRYTFGVNDSINLKAMKEVYRAEKRRYATHYATP